MAFESIPNKREAQHTPNINEIRKGGAKEVLALVQVDTRFASKRGLKSPLLRLFAALSASVLASLSTGCSGMEARSGLVKHADDGFDESWSQELDESIEALNESSQRLSQETQKILRPEVAAPSVDTRTDAEVNREFMRALLRDPAMTDQQIDDLLEQ